MASQELEIKLLGRRFLLRCGEGELDQLRKAASLLEQKLEQLKRAGSSKDVEQLALLTALNLSHELLQEQKRAEELTCSMENRITNLQATVEKALHKQITIPFSSDTLPALNKD